MTYDISDAEWQIMHVVWDAPADRRARRSSPLSSGRQAGRRPPSRRCCTALSESACCDFQPKETGTSTGRGVRREDCVRRASQSFAERVFGGEAAPMLLHLVSSRPALAGRLSQKLKRLLKRGRKANQ